MRGNERLNPATTRIPISHPSYRTLLRLGAAALLALAVVVATLGRMAAPAGAQGSASGVAYPVANILCKFSNVPGEPTTKDHVQNMVLNNGTWSLDHVFRESSYGAVNFTGTQSFGWYSVPNPSSAYNGTNPGDMFRLLDDCADAAGSDVDFNDFDVVNVWANDSMGGSSGFAFIDGATLTLGGVTKHYRFAIIPSSIFSMPKTIAHELGHAFGMKHVTGGRWDMVGVANLCQATDIVSAHLRVIGRVVAAGAFR